MRKWVDDGTMPGAFEFDPPILDGWASTAEGRESYGRPVEPRIESGRCLRCGKECERLLSVDVSEDEYMQVDLCASCLRALANEVEQE